MLTLNQTIEISKNFTFKHKALGKTVSQSNFYFGDKWEVGASFEPAYPFLWKTLVSTKYDKSGLITRTFEVDVSDKVNLGESNENHVLSDTQEICFDYIDYLQLVADSGELGAMTIGEISQLTDYTEDRDDNVTGHYFTIDIVSHREGASCNLPIFDGNILDGNYIYVGGSVSGGFLVEIKDQDGNVFETFNTSGEYIVTVLSKIKQVIGNTSTTIIQDIID